MIEIKNLYKSFGPQDVLKDFNLKLDRPGKVSAILGPNGCGKSTLIKCVLGLVIPDSGEIMFDGEEIQRKWEYRKRISYLPQYARFPENLKVQELLAMIADIRKLETDYDHLLDIFEVRSFLDKRIRSLSGGMRQKVNLLIAFLDDNQVVILDEPTTGLDPVSLVKFKKYLNTQRDSGKYILLTTHIMSLVEEMADEIIFIHAGRIHFRGSVEDAISESSAQNLEQAIAQRLIKRSGNPSSSKDLSHVEGS